MLRVTSQLGSKTFLLLLRRSLDVFRRVRIAREVYLIFSIDLHKPELAKKLGKLLMHIVPTNRDLRKTNCCVRVRYLK